MAEEFETVVEIPNIQYPPVDTRTGLWVPVWYQVMEGLWQRTGGSEDLIFQNTVDISNKADKSIQIIAGDGLDGGGTLAADITIDVNIDEALDLVGSTVGSVLVRGASGWQILIPGTAGYSLTSNGAGLLPSYQETAADACLDVVEAPTGLVITTEDCGTVFTNES